MLDMSNVTDMRKCYIIECLSCKKLTHVFRKNALTCGVACRVHLHRHPEILDAHKKIVTKVQLRLFRLLEARAIEKLRPDLRDKILRGDFKKFDPIRGETDEMDAVRDEIVKSYAELATDTKKDAAIFLRYLRGE